MAIELKMPALSPTMEQGTLAKWLKAEGDRIEPGDIIAEIETDKATMEFEAIDEGVLSKILIAAGTEDVAVGTVIAHLEGEGEEKCAFTCPCAHPDRVSGAGYRSRRQPQGRKAGSRRSGQRSFAPRRHQLHQHLGARGAARRHGRGNAPRQTRLRDGRGGRRIPGRLQGHAGPAR